MTKFKAEPRHWILIVALLLALYASYLLIAPFMGPIMLAFVLSLLCFPAHVYIKQKMPEKPNLAAFVSCMLLVVVILIPAIVVFMAIVQQAISVTKRMYNWLNNGGAEQILQHPYVNTVLEKINQFAPESITAQDIIDRLAGFAAGFGKELLDLSTHLVGGITGFLFNALLMLFVLFFLLRDQQKIVNGLHWIIPLSRSQEDELLIETRKVARSAVLGSFVTGIAQGIAGGVAMAIVGLPALFLGTMMAVASFIPVVGTALVWLPASIYLAATGDWPWAIFMLVWGAVVVGSIDNLLRPILMSGSVKMNTLLIFLSLIGGLQLFGVIGLIYGPIIFALTMVLIRLYSNEFQDFLEQQDKT